MNIGSACVTGRLEYMYVFPLFWTENCLAVFEAYSSITKLQCQTQKYEFIYTCVNTYLLLNPVPTIPR